MPLQQAGNITKFKLNCNSSEAQEVQEVSWIDLNWAIKHNKAINGAQVSHNYCISIACSREIVETCWDGLRQLYPHLLWPQSNAFLAGQGFHRIPRLWNQHVERFWKMLNMLDVAHCCTIFIHFSVFLHVFCDPISGSVSGARPARNAFWCLLDLLLEFRSIFGTRVVN